MASIRGRRRWDCDISLRRESDPICILIEMHIWWCRNMAYMPSYSVHLPFGTKKIVWFNLLRSRSNQASSPWHATATVDESMHMARCWLLERYWLSNGSGNIGLSIGVNQSRWITKWTDWSNGPDWPDGRMNRLRRSIFDICAKTRHSGNLSHTEMIYCI